MFAVAADPINQVQALDLTVAIAIMLAAIHLWYRHLHRWLYQSERIALSFSGGMAISYVFIHLLPTLEQGQRLLGAPIHFLTLLGFLLYLRPATLSLENYDKGNHSAHTFIFLYSDNLCRPEQLFTYLCYS